MKLNVSAMTAVSQCRSVYVSKAYTHSCIYSVCVCVQDIRGDVGESATTVYSWIMGILGERARASGWLCVGSGQNLHPTIVVPPPPNEPDRTEHHNCPEPVG